jgi:nucleotidyltransferase/DNA polymerase involved in DNA repair
VPRASVGGAVVLAASYEAKAFGIQGGMPGRRARELCPDVIFANGHFEMPLIKLLNDFTPLVERISIDAAFADVACCTDLFGPPSEIANAIRRRVGAELGLQSQSASRAQSTSRKLPRKRLSPMDQPSLLRTAVAGPLHVPPRVPPLSR